jgi:hypothetical protein
VIEFPPNFLFPLEAIVEQWITFHLEARQLDGYDPAVSQVRGAIDGRHPCSRREAFNAVVVKLIARLKKGHGS